MNINEQFIYDRIRDDLVSGRMCGSPIPVQIADTLIEILRNLNWKPSYRKMAGALPHFPTQFGEIELRNTIYNLGYDSAKRRNVGQLFGRVGQSATCSSSKSIDLNEHEGGPTLCAQKEEGRDTCVVKLAPNESILFSAQGAEAKKALGSKYRNWFDKQFRSLVVKLGAYTLLSTVTTVLLAIAVMYVFDIAIRSLNIEVLYYAFSGLIVLACFDLYFRNTRGKLVSIFSARLEFLLGVRLIKSYLSLEPNKQEGLSKPTQISKLRTFESAREVISGPVPLILFELSISCAILLAMYFVSVRMGVLLTAIILVVSLIVYCLSKLAKRSYQSYNFDKSSFDQLQHELLINQSLIVRFGVMDAWKRRYTRAVKKLSEKRKGMSLYFRCIDYVAFSFVSMSTVAILGFGSFLAIDGQVTSAQLVASAILSTRIVSPIQQCLVVFSRMPELYQKFEGLHQFLDVQGDEEHDDLSSTSLHGSQIDLISVTLRRVGSNSLTLSSVDLSISPGCKVALFGDSEQGKSALLRVIAGLEQPQFGDVRIGGMNPFSRPVRSSGRSVYYINNETAYFFGTPAQNLRLVDPESSDESLINLLCNLGLKSWISQLPMGIHTKLDTDLQSVHFDEEIDVTFSFALAILSKPKVLLIDNFVHRVSASRAKLLLNYVTLNLTNTTVIVSSSDKDVINQFDRAIVLRSGELKMYRKDMKYVV